MGRRRRARLVFRVNRGQVFTAPAGWGACGDQRGALSVRRSARLRPNSSGRSPGRIVPGPPDAPAVLYSAPAVRRLSHRKADHGEHHQHAQKVLAEIHTLDIVELPHRNLSHGSQYGVIIGGIRDIFGEGLQCYLVFEYIWIPQQMVKRSRRNLSHGLQYGDIIGEIRSIFGKHLQCYLVCEYVWIPKKIVHKPRSESRLEKNCSHSLEPATKGERASEGVRSRARKLHLIQVTLENATK